MIYRYCRKIKMVLLARNGRENWRRARCPRDESIRQMGQGGEPKKFRTIRWLHIQDLFRSPASAGLLKARLQFTSGPLSSVRRMECVSLPFFLLSLRADSTVAIL